MPRLTTKTAEQLRSDIKSGLNHSHCCEALTADGWRDRLGLTDYSKAQIKRQIEVLANAGDIIAIRTWACVLYKRQYRPSDD